MDSIEAKAMMFAIPMQESRWDARRQIGGAAHGFAQFELSGIRGVLNDKASQPLIRSVLDRLDYDYKPETSYAAIEHNDVLCLAYMRCLLWTIHDPLPEQGDAEEGWIQYLECWRPGAPRHATWAGFYAAAWKMALA
jgi:hypothetical protein